MKRDDLADVLFSRPGPSSVSSFEWDTSSGKETIARGTLTDKKESELNV